MMSTGRPRGVEVRLREAGYLVATRGGDAAGQAGIRRVRGRRDDQPAEAEAQLERLQHVGAGLAQHVGAGDAQVGRAGLDVDRHVARLHHQKLDRGVARRDQQAAPRVGRRAPRRPGRKRSTDGSYSRPLASATRSRLTTRHLGDARRDRATRRPPASAGRTAPSARRSGRRRRPRGPRPPTYTSKCMPV